MCECSSFQVPLARSFLRGRQLIRTHIPQYIYNSHVAALGIIPWGRCGTTDRGFKQDMIACMGEFIGTTMFIFLGLGCVKTAQDSQTSSQLQTATTLSNETLIFISVGMGFSLLITAWVFYRITGGLFVGGGGQML